MALGHDMNQLIEWGGLAFQVVSAISFLAVTIYVARKNNKTIEDKILPTLEKIKIDVEAIKITTGDVKSDHDKLILVEEKAKGIQAGLTTVRNEQREHIRIYHSKS